MDENTLIIQSPFKFDIFISYSSDPDYKLALHLKSFIETFHKTNSTKKLRPLRACIDFIDFQAKRKVGYNPSNELINIVTDNLRQSRELLVLCSNNSRNSKWVEYEIQWFLENRGSHAIRLAVSEGNDPIGQPDQIFSHGILTNELHKGKWYDFRGFYKKNKGIKKQGDFNANKIQLTADLLNCPAGDILPLWEFEQQYRKIRKVLSIIIILIGILLVTGYYKIEKERLEIENLIRTIGVRNWN